MLLQILHSILLLFLPSHLPRPLPVRVHVHPEAPVDVGVLAALAREEAVALGVVQEVDLEVARLRELRHGGPGDQRGPGGHVDLAAAGGVLEEDDMGLQRQ